MKLEVPCQRIMRGEASTLSPSASKLLLILLGCQTKEERTVSRSKNTFLRITGLKKSAFFAAKKELADYNWIILDGPVITIALDEQTVQPDEQTVHTRGHLVHTDGQTVHARGHLVHEEKAIVQRSGHLVQLDGQIVHARGHRSDQSEDLKDQDSELLASLAIRIADYYTLSPSEQRQLWSIIKDQNQTKVRAIFVSMQKQTIRDPIAYIMTSIGNDRGNHLFQEFANALPEE